ncbi:MAG: hypothetical protein GY916_06915 [Gammaproteobacteria bacterium]|nr:hypothetical protein [Gammaproteobacteria bacterium]
MLLSEQDLNRLDQYIKNKNRLHNRNQHGWGVVNGLFVLCDPCDQIVVSEGYAVDPCGDDIVVCEDTKVNICELIRKCKQAEPKPECEPFHRPPNSNCDDIEEVWVLTIKYNEWASRGITALRGNTCGTPGCQTCGSRGGCSCGSGGACGACGVCGGSESSCGCGSTSARAGAYAKQNDRIGGTKNRGAPQQCEPTVTCEGYSFGVYKKPVEDPRDDDDDRLFELEGSFWDHFNCCAQPLVDAIPPTPDLSNDDDLVEFGIAISQWCCQFRENLLNYFLTHRNTSCEIIDYLRAVNCPNINSPGTFVVDFIRSFLQLLAAWAEGLKNCFCLSLLPQVPQAACDARVPLATVRIRARDCHILSICNWTRERKIMVTWPAVMHWLSVVPIADFIRDLLDRICCNSLLGIFDDVLQKYPQGDPQAAASTNTFSNSVNSDNSFDSVETVSFSQSMHLASGSLASGLNLNLNTKVNSFASLVDSVLERGGEPLELGAVLNAVSPRFKLPDNGKKLSSVEARNLPSLLLSEVMVKPVLGTFIGNSKAAARVAAFQLGLGGEQTEQPSDTAAAELKEQLETLRLQVKQQESRIETLQKKFDD